MDEKEELKRELELELQWVQYKQRILDIIEKKLLLMRQVAEHAKQDNLTAEKLEALNTELKSLAAQIKALDGESRRTYDEKIFE